MLRSDVCDYSDAYIVVKETIYIAVDRNNDMTQKGVVFKTNAPFSPCISKINKTFIKKIHNAEDLDIIMPVCNLLEYSDNFSMTSGRLWNCYRDEVDNVNDYHDKSFNYKTKITEKTEARPAHKVEMIEILTHHHEIQYKP